MARVNAIQTNFTGGQISPRLFGRVDIESYRNSLKTLENMVVYPQGGAGRRFGTMHVAEGKDSAAGTDRKFRLVPFEYSDTNAYCLEFGHNYIRFYAQSAQVVSGSAVEVVTTYTNAQLDELQFAQSADVLYIVHRSHPPRQLVRNSATSFTLSDVVFVDGPYLDDNTTAITIASSATTGSVTLTASSSLFTADHVGAFFRITNTSTGYAKVTAFTNATTVTATVVSTLGGTSAVTTWREGAFSAERGYPGCITFFEQRLCLAGTTHRPQTVWVSKVDDYENFTPGANDDDPIPFTIAANKVNIIQWLSQARNSLFIGTVGAEWQVKGSAGAAITPGNIIVRQQTSEGSARIQPVPIKNALLFVQRGGEKMHEITFDFLTDSFQAPDLTLLSEDITSGGVTHFDAQRTPDPIIWAVLSDGTLSAMTYQPDQKIQAWHSHTIGGVSGSATITVTDYANIVVGTDIVVTKSDGNTVTFTSEAISGSAPSTTNGWRPNESNDTTADNIYTAINAHSDFTVANPAANVVTITETQRLGTGPTTLSISDTVRLATTDETAAVVESVAVIPKDITAGIYIDQVWLGVKRTINGAIKRYVEYIDSTLNTDSTLIYSGSSTSSLSGLSHLEGQTVAVKVNDAPQPDKIVSSAAIAISPAGSSAQVGLPYTHTLTTLPPEFGAQAGASLSRLRRIHEVVLYLRASSGGLINNDSIIYRSSADDMGNALPLFTGTVRYTPDDSWDRDGNITISGTQPLPFNLTALIMGTNVSEG